MDGQHYTFEVSKTRSMEIKIYQNINSVKEIQSFRYNFKCSIDCRFTTSSKYPNKYKLSVHNFLRFFLFVFLVSLQFSNKFELLRKSAEKKCFKKTTAPKTAQTNTIVVDFFSVIFHVNCMPYARE